MTSTPAPAPRLNALSIVVADMGATLAFYRRLGLDIPDGADTEMHAEALAGDLRLLFDTRAVVESFTPEWVPPSGGHRVALAFECATPAAVDAWHADLVGAGYTSLHDPFDAVWGQRYAVIADPDGNPVDLYAALG